MRYWSLLVASLSCLSCSVATAPQAERPAAPAEAALPGYVSSSEQLRSNVTLQHSTRGTQDVYGNSYRIHFGQQLVSIKTSYREIAGQETTASGAAPANPAQRYFDLRASSAVPGTSLVGDGELAYGVFSSSPENIRPAMMRFGLTNRSSGLAYGADYRTVAKGFTPVTGPVADHTREEAQIWGEHGWGALNLRGSLGELRERFADNADARLTRFVATTLRINRAAWTGSLFSSYGLIGQDSEQAEETRFSINRVTTSYRPNEFLLLEPNFSLREEWSQENGARTQTPSSGFSITYTPLRNVLRLTGGTTFSRTFSRDGSNDTSIHGTSAAVDWRIGNFLGRNDSLSLTFNYDRRLDHVYRTNSHDGITGMLQFKFAGF
jgi:hypothetical protein